jgi:tetratricopeptide (TPR) repeat protein
MPGTRKKTGPLSLEEAEALYDDQAESMANLLWVKSDAYFHAGRYDDVIELAKAVVNLDPGFVEAWLGAAWFLWSDEERDRDPEAIELYHMAMERNPQAWDIPFEMGFLYYYSHKRDAKTALPYIQKAAEVAPPSQKAKVLRALGQVFRKLGRTKEALETFREVLKINPSDVVAKREVERLRGLVEP